MARKNADIPLTWDEWTDALGQTYRAGDYIAYAMISGRSPQLVIAQVLEIRRLDGNFNPIVTYEWDYENLNERGGPSRKTAPYCKVKVRPIRDSRGFYRSNTSRPWQGPVPPVHTDVKAVTLSIPENIIKVDVPAEWTAEHIAETLAADLTVLREELQG